MEFFLIDLGTALAVPLAYLTLVAIRRRHAPAMASRRPVISHTAPDAVRERRWGSSGYP